MAEMIVYDNNWQLTDTSPTITYTKTLKTAGQFVDKDIKVEITAKKGSVSISNQNLTTIPTIQYISDKDKYSVSVKDNIVIIPQITEGWVSSGTGGIVYVEGSLNLESSKINAKLILDDSETSGYSIYRTTATKGYNENDLNSDILVYQGIIS